ncbi:MAG: carboxypeptidase regulatory-like domain-containing protein [Oscillospiraceae bacterium]|jgi:protocatechuate 3,4-dioxygenase beta subunit|nr:carboxypeptidase regulatory-like domain-containing protein [Oscillospiraceae bacterium]
MGITYARWSFKAAVTAVVIIIILSLHTAALADLNPVPPGNAARVGDATYIVADPNASVPATLWLSVIGATTSINNGEPTQIILDGGQTLPINGAPLPGVSFEVIALNASGSETPWPDPLDPAQPWIITVDTFPEPLLLPIEPALYLKQLTAPDGYTMIDDLIPLTNAVPFGEMLAIINQLAGGLVEITANESITFTIIDSTGAYAASGAVEPGVPWAGVLPAGDYLFALNVPAGFIPLEPYGIEVLSGGLERLNAACEPMARLSVRIQTATFTSAGERVLAPVADEIITLTSFDGSALRMQTDATGLARRADQDDSGPPTILPGEYTLRVGHEPDRLITLEPGEVFNWDILTHDGTGQIRLITQAYETRSSIAALSGVSVSITSDSDGARPSRSMTTDGTGVLWLSGLPEGSYTLTLDETPQGYTAFKRQMSIEIRGGEEASATLVFTKNARVSVNRQARVIDATGAVSLVSQPGSYTAADAVGDTIGIVDASAAITLPAALDGTSYTFRETEPVSGFQPDPIPHTITVYPGDDVTLDAFVDSVDGLFALSHEDPYGASVRGGSFTLISLDDDSLPPLRFSMGDSSGYKAPQPFPPGRYRLTLTEAANGYMADPAFMPILLDFTLEPYLLGDGTSSDTLSRVAFVSAPIPGSAQHPAPVWTPAETILELNDERETRLTLALADQQLPVNAAEFILDMNSETGVSFSGITIPDVDGIETARVFIGYDTDWIDQGYETLPAVLRWDDVRETVRSVRIVLGGDETPPSAVQSVFTLNGIEIEAAVRALPRLSVDAAVTLNARMNITTPVQIGEDQWREVGGQSAPSARLTLITPHRASQGSVFEDRDMDRVRGLNDAGVPLVRVTASNSSGIVIAEALTDSDGAFVFDEQVPSSASLTLSFDELYQRTSARYALLSQSGWRFAVLPESVLTGAVNGPPALMIRSSDIVISLWRNGELAASTAADEAGSFRINGLAPGEYALLAELPPGYLPVDPPRFVALPYGGTASVDIAAQTAAELSGRVEVRGLNASYTSRIAVSLTSENGQTAYEASAGADGSFTLDTIEPGEYTLRWILPSDAALEAGIPKSETVSLLSGGRLERGVTIVPAASIIGSIKDHEGAPTSGVNVVLVTPDGSVKTRMSDEEGGFIFTGLAAGSYSLEPALPDGMILHSGETQFTLSIGETAQAEWIAFIPASVSGVVWMNNGGGESPLAGIRIVAADAQGNELFSTETDSEGAYSFKRLRPGETRLLAYVPDGMALTIPPRDKLLEFIPSEQEQSGAVISESFTLKPGQDEVDAHIGMVCVASIEAVVWQDRDDDGLRDSADPPIMGVKVTLTKDGETLTELTSNADGIARFDRVKPGGYTLTVDVPEGFAPPTEVKQEEGQPFWPIQVGFDSSDVQAQLPLTPLTDLTGTARRASGETTPGLLVRIKASDGGIIAEAMSDETGSFTLRRLRPGNYIVVYELPETGWAFEGTDERSISRALTVSDNLRVITVPPLTALGSITGSFYMDMNGDGGQDDDDPGVDGVEITILGGDGRTFSAVTDRRGGFIIGELRSGSYTINAVPPDGVSFMGGDSIWHVELNMGAVLTVGPIGVYELASLGGLILDEAGDPLSDARLSLSRLGALVGSAVTDDDGAYRFSSLKPGKYTLSASLPDGYLFVDANDTEPITFTVRSGERASARDIGVVKSASIAGRVWLDTVYDGMPGANEPPLPGVMITLLDAAGAAVRQSLTSDDGSYIIGELLPGEYRLHAALPDGLIFTKPEKPFEGGSVMPLTSARQAFSDAFTLTPGQALMDCGAGAVEAGSISGETYADANADGRRGLDESPLPNVRVTLIDENDVSITSVTGGDGRFRFEPLRPGMYSLAYAWPGDYVDSGETVDSATLRMGDALDDLRAGATRLGSVSGMVFEDMDADGMRGANDSPVAGANVTAETDHGSFSAVTDESGAYLIEGLPPGAVVVSFILPDGMMFTRQQDGGSMAETTDENQSRTRALTLVMGGALNDVDAGVMRSGSIGDFAWIDSNMNGMQDYDEPGIAGLVLTLERGADGQWTKAGETTTDANGYYEFSGLRPGTYRLLAAAMEGWLPTRRADKLPEINSNLRFRADDPMITDLVLVESNKRVRNVDLGFVKAADAKDKGWVVQDGGEIMVP